MYDLPAIRRNLPLPSLLVRLGLFEFEPTEGVYKCPLHDERVGKSFSISRKNSGWVAKCHGGKCGFAGDEFDLIQRFFCLSSRRDAFVKGAELTGVSLGTSSYDPCKTLPRRVTSPPCEPSRYADLPPMPDDVREIWNEGSAYLESHPELVSELAQWRGWPVKWAQHLVKSGDIGYPMCYGERRFAIPVYAPSLDPTDTLPIKMIGFHARLNSKKEGERASWVFMPNSKIYGQTTPPMPYIIGAWNLSNARLLVILGGQWDAMTFAFAAEWRGDGCSIPDGVCVIGIRGDKNTNVFLEAYGLMLPRGCNVLLIPDNDESGREWFERTDGNKPFAKQLSTLGCKVAVVTTHPHKDFNDFYKASSVGPEIISELLADNGMALEREGDQ
jgi:hypothetical protein